jgi:hypothetical protein
MFHAGLGLELSRIIWDDRRAEAGQGRPALGLSKREDPERRSVWMRMRHAPAPARLAVQLRAVQDPWRWWRVVEPDAEYLRRRAA